MPGVERRKTPDNKGFSRNSSYCPSQKGDTGRGSGGTLLLSPLHHPLHRSGKGLESTIFPPMLLHSFSAAPSKGLYT